MPRTHFASQAQPGGAQGFASPGDLWPSFVFDTEQGLGDAASHPPSPGPSHTCLLGDSLTAGTLSKSVVSSASSPRRLPLSGSKRLLKRQQPVLRRPPCAGETDRQTDRQADR